MAAFASAAGNRGDKARDCAPPDQWCLPRDVEPSTPQALPMGGIPDTIQGAATAYFRHLLPAEELSDERTRMIDDFCGCVAGVEPWVVRMPLREEWRGRLAAAWHAGLAGLAGFSGRARVPGRLSERSKWRRWLSKSPRLRRSRPQKSVASGMEPRYHLKNYRRPSSVEFHLGNPCPEETPPTSPAFLKIAVQIL